MHTHLEACVKIGLCACLHVGVHVKSETQDVFQKGNKKVGGGGLRGGGHIKANTPVSASGHH